MAVTRLTHVLKFSAVKRIYLANNLSQAQLVVDMLEQLWIPAHIENIYQSGGLGELAVTYPEVWLQRDQDESRALQVINEYEARAGRRFVELKCPRCGERSPATFDWCWSCGAELA